MDPDVQSALRKRRLVLVLGGLGLSGPGPGLAFAYLPVGLFLYVILQSFAPQTIGWDAKNAWAKCEGAVTGRLSWPAAADAACEAMHMCANEANLDAKQYAALVAGIRRLPKCGDP